MSCARSAGLEVGTQTVDASCLQALWQSALPHNVRCSCRPLVSAHDSPPRPASIPASLQLMIALSFAGSFVSNPTPLESYGVGGLQ
jgi:hypothetical protein